MSRPNALPAPRPIRDGFEFRNVSFAYPGSSKLVLDRSQLPHRSRRAGRAGRGKRRRQDNAGETPRAPVRPHAGAILLDGADLREYEVEDLRNEIGVIFQDYMRYDMRVVENIGFGRIEALGR